MLNRELDSVISRIQIVFSFVCRKKVEQLGYITLTDKPWSLRHSFRADVIMPGGRWPETENKRICQTVSSCRFLLGLPIFRGRGRLRNLSGVRSRKRKWKKMKRTHDRRLQYRIIDSLDNMCRWNGFLLWKETEIIFWHRYRIMVDNDHTGNSDVHELGPKGTEKQFQL